NCVTHTDANGKYFVRFPDNDAITADQELHFLYRAQGYQDYNSPHFKVQGATFEPAPMLKIGAVPPPGCDTPGTPTKSVFLPNITRRFFGFDTPFIIQNLGTAATSATARFVSFDGSVPTVTALRTIDPGRSQFIDPNYEPGLVDGHQYAVTVTSPVQPIS